MNAREKELQELLETVSTLRVIAWRREQELPQVSWYFGVWGLYGTINLALELLPSGGRWAQLLFLAFFLSTLPVAGFLPSLLVWGGVAALVWGGYVLAGGWVALGLTITGAVGAYAFLYHRGMQTGRFRSRTSLRNAIAPWIGWTCGFMAAGMALTHNALYAIGALNPDRSGPISLLLWGYMTSVMLMIWGVYHPVLFVLGVGSLFAIPLATMLVSPLAGHVAFLLVFAAMALTGFSLYVRGKAHEPERL